MCRVIFYDKGHILYLSVRDIKFHYFALSSISIEIQEMCKREAEQTESLKFKVKLIVHCVKDVLQIYSLFEN